ncbi:hypothetical protein QYE76_003412 [Lolium multiflorum]|uniref:Reverse transcriptase domain-containing protein n=1 Tax=Lolium multiflorum TaxID=4521 RepID=A0AAD8RRD8_LOLMU|nr:hypothetical protein QYE76_003412 [Lolium multiflorum]
MGVLATNFYHKLFTADSSVIPSVIVDDLQRKVTAEMNKSLCEEMTEDEITHALFQIGAQKAPGPDGLPAQFFHKNWDILKDEIVSAVQSFFKTGIMPEGVNNSTIVLIPKTKNPSELKDFRPISLCNVLYKIIAKCIINRLRPCLSQIVSPKQSAFIKGRQIADNALVAFECIHTIQHARDKKGTFCAYKLDLSKAYGRVDWAFLESALLKLGFDNHWITRVMACVKSVKYSVRMNGALQQTFSPSRGLRQGDPLSSFLFLFVAEGFSSCFKKEIESGRLHELKITRNAPGISHLLFPDDSLIFFEATAQQAIVIKETLDKYEKGTGQLLSQEKCSILFGNNCQENNKSFVNNILGNLSVNFEEKYLGLPVPNGRMKNGKFEPIKERYKKKLNDWTEKYASSAAKEVLIKSVAQAIPLHAMSVFKFSVSLCEDLMRMTRKFWWDEEDDKKNIHWSSWDKLTQRKSKGGMQTPDRKGKSLLFPVIASGEKKDKVNNSQKWTKPPLGWAKVNTDASFIHANGTAHWGAIVRDDHGNTIFSAWSPIPRCATPEEAEAIAVLEGLRLASALDSPCYLETDCKSIIDSWNDNKNWRSQAGIVINEAKQAALSFQNLKIEFIPRTANSAAHLLAAFSRSTSCNGLLYGSVPECILDQVLSDCNQNNIT